MIVYFSKIVITHLAIWDFFIRKIFVNNYVTLNLVVNALFKLSVL